MKCRLEKKLQRLEKEVKDLEKINKTLRDKIKEMWADKNQ